MQTHQLIVHDDHICALGNGLYFSWIIEYVCGEWDLSTIYGRHQCSSKSFREILKKIGYERMRYGQR